MTDQDHRSPEHIGAHTPRPVGWAVTPGLTAYPAALAAMEKRAADIRAKAAPELLWLLEHPPLYTGGTSARREDLLSANGFPVYETGRGGQYTYHGPGQRIAYVMVDVRARFSGDIHHFVATLEGWLIDALARLGIEGVVREGRVGIWVPRQNAGSIREDKIAALGIRVRRGVSFHGVSLNVSPDLSHYNGIVPCGIREHGVTSIKDLTGHADMVAVDQALRAAAPPAFGSIENSAPPL